MSTRSTKTIDDLGFGVYSKYEEDRKYFDEQILSESKQVVSQTSVDIFEPILISEHYILFDLNQGKGSWSMFFAPKQYNDQKKRLFTYQLAPKLGPEEMIDVHINRIEGKRDRELASTKKSKETKEASSNDKVTREQDKKGQNQKEEPEEELLPTSGKKNLKVGKEINLQSFIIDNKESKQIQEEAKILIQLMQDINVLNKLIAYIDAERHRYNKG